MKSWLMFAGLVLATFGAVSCAPETQDDAPQLDLTGQVLLENEETHQGINVHAAFDTGGLVGQTQTDPEGRFIFRNVPLRTFRLTFSKPGFDTQTDIIARFSGDNAVINDGEPVTLRPDRSASLQGELQSPLDIDFSAQSSVSLTGNGPEVTITPNADGSFEQIDLRPGAYTMRVTAQGHLPFFQGIELTTDSALQLPQPIALIPQSQDVERRVTLSGRVDLLDTDDDSGAIVRIQVGDGLISTEITDTDGRFAVQTSRLDHTISISKAGYSLREGLPPQIEVQWVEDEGEEDQGRFVFDGQRLEEATFGMVSAPTATLSGTLASTLGPLDDWPQRASVLVAQENDSFARIATVSNAEDGQGRFQIAALAPGSYTLTVQADGHQRATDTIDVQVPATELETIALAAQSARFSAQIINAATDQPLSGALITARRGEVQVQAGLSDAEGAFSLALTPERHTLDFFKDGFEAHPPVTLDWNGQNFDVDSPVEGEPPFAMVPTPTAGLNGLVQSAQGGRNDWPNIAFATLNDGQNTRITTVFNADQGRGQFQFVAIPPGSHTLSVSAQGHDLFTAQIDLSPGANTLQDVLNQAIIELTVPDNDQLAAMTGLVRLQGEDPQDGNHGGVTITALVENNAIDDITTARSGAFTFTVARQNHRLVLAAPGFIERSVEVIWDEIDERFETQGQPLLSFPLVLSADPQRDRDIDGVIDALDNCLEDFNPNQRDIDGDTLGDACDLDIDGDGFTNGQDNCPLGSNPMQEDTLGLGIGTACNQGTQERPVEVGCGVTNHAMDTRARPDALNGRCGGFDSGEVVYNLNIAQDEGWQVQVSARHSVVIYVLDSLGNELLCEINNTLDLSDLPSGQYQIVVDGLQGSESEGLVQVSIGTLDTCLPDFSGSVQDVIFLASAPYQVKLADMNKDGSLDIVAMLREQNCVQYAEGFGNGEFDAQQGAPCIDVGHEPANMAIGDIDNDGLQDIVTTSVSGTGISILRASTPGVFLPHETIDLGGPTSGVLVGDFNKDGMTDVIVSQPLSNQLSVLLGVGEGAFAPATQFETHNGPQQLHQGDFDLDGQMDLAIRHTNDVSVMLASGPGTFSAPDVYNISGLTQGIDIGDLNNDGLVDIIATNNNTGDANIFIATGEGQFLAPERILTQRTLSSIHLDDINDDQRTDIIGLPLDQRALLIAFGSSTGTFSYNFESNAQLNGAIDIATGDIDNDGDKDIILAHANLGYLSKAINRQGRFFGSALNTNTRNQPTNLHTGDFNNDGHADLFIAHQLDPFVEIFHGDGRGGLSSAQRLDTGLVFPDTALGDFDGDGLTDVVLYSNIPLTGLLFLHGQEDGTFTLQPDPVVLQNTVFGPNPMATGDFDRDGLTDVAIAHNNGGLTLWLTGPQTQIQLPNDVTSPGALLAHNFNDDEDGHLDLVIIDRIQHTMTLHEGNGQGQFTPQPPISTVNPDLLEPPTSTQTDAVVGDFNGDGKSDIALIRKEDAELVIVRQRAEGVFCPTVPMDIPTAPDSIILADLNGDHAIDLLTLHQNNLRQTNRITGHINKEALKEQPNEAEACDAPTDFDFDAQINISDLDSPNDAAVADFNDDGQNDIITITSNNQASLYLARRPHTQGTQPITQMLPPCPTQDPVVANENDNDGDQYQVTPATPCSVTRLEFTNAPNTTTPLTLSAPHGFEQTFSSPQNDTDWRPETLNPLARFENAPANGTWTLFSDTPLNNPPTLLINHFPQDPFTSDQPALACTNTPDHGADPESICVLGPELSDIVLGEDGEDRDEDAFLLQGDIDGAFFQSQTITVSLDTDPEAEIVLELRALRARGALATAVEVDPGLWVLSFTVPAQYNLRYFSIHVSGPDHLDLPYDLSVQTTNP